jgi:hypothetical protein
MHFAVAHSVPALTAFGVDENFAGHFLGCQIKMKSAGLGLEASANGVEYVGEGEIDGGVLRVELQFQVFGRSEAGES